MLRKFDYSKKSGAERALLIESRQVPERRIRRIMLFSCRDVMIFLSTSGFGLGLDLLSQAHSSGGKFKIA